MKLPIKVHHRVDGLEICREYGFICLFVHHRVDGLEIMLLTKNFFHLVHHRVDGLEMNCNMRH